jgi:hypothetical protein
MKPSQGLSISQAGADVLKGLIRGLGRWGEGEATIDVVVDEAKSLIEQKHVRCVAGLPAKKKRAKKKPKAEIVKVIDAEIIDDGKS